MDVFNPKVVRCSMGAAVRGRVDVAEASRFVEMVCCPTGLHLNLTLCVDFYTLMYTAHFLTGSPGGKRPIMKMKIPYTRCSYFWTVNYSTLPSMPTHCASMCTYTEFAMCPAKVPKSTSGSAVHPFARLAWLHWSAPVECLILRILSCANSCFFNLHNHWHVCSRPSQISCFALSLAVVERAKTMMDAAPEVCLVSAEVWFGAFWDAILWPLFEWHTNNTGALPRSSYTSLWEEGTSCVEGSPTFLRLSIRLVEWICTPQL